MELHHNGVLTYKHHHRKAKQNRQISTNKSDTALKDKSRAYKLKHLHESSQKLIYIILFSFPFITQSHSLTSPSTTAAWHALNSAIVHISL